MGKKMTDKTFCKWDKDEIKANIAVILELTDGPNFVCRKCARVAKRKINVCKPHAVDKQP